jgi:hypothetical protein
VRVRRHCPYSAQDLRGHAQEGLFHPSGRLGGGFDEAHSEGIRQGLALLRLNDPIFFHVRLVPHQQFENVFPGLCVNIVYPPSDAVERMPVRDIVHDNDSVGGAVVRVGDGPKALLSRCIPQLQLDSFLLQLDCFESLLLEQEKKGVSESGLQPRLVFDC